MQRRDGLILLLLCAATLALYIPSVRFGFVRLDDPDYVFKNARVLRGLSADNVVWAFTTLDVGNWHPLTWLSHMLDVQMFGPIASGFRACAPQPQAPA